MKGNGLLAALVKFYRIRINSGLATAPRTAHHRSCVSEQHHRRSGLAQQSLEAAGTVLILFRAVSTKQSTLWQAHCEGSSEGIKMLFGVEDSWYNKSRSLPFWALMVSHTMLPTMLHKAI